MKSWLNLVSRSLNEMVGRSDLLEMRKAVDHYKAQGLDYSKILHRPEVGSEVGTFCQMKQDHLLEKCLDNREILDKAQPLQSKTESPLR